MKKKYKERIIWFLIGGLSFLTIIFGMDFIRLILFIYFVWTHPNESW